MTPSPFYRRYRAIKLFLRIVFRTGHPGYVPSRICGHKGRISPALAWQTAKYLWLERERV